jgi:hypothetical protein
MRKYVAAAFSIAIGTEPAMALEAGVGAQAGNVGIGTSVGVGQKGASIGIGAGVGSVGGADAGASVGTGNGSVGASIGASGQLGGASVGVSGQLRGEGASSESSAAGAPGDTPGHSAAAYRSNSIAAGGPHSIVLPRILRPYGRSGRSSRQGGGEIRQARIRCHLDATGRVIGLT